MAAPGSEVTAAALRRFGLGAKPGDLDRIGGDVRGALMAELDSKATALSPRKALQPTAELYRQKAVWERYVQARTSKTGGGAAAYAPKPIQPEWQRYYEEVAARLAHVSSPLIGINERLVWFWANHLCVSSKKNGWIGVTAGAYEREAIRPNIFGSYYDLVLASARHYAMLMYLDNARSVGPSSDVGRATGKGINENYARELLELHTMGVGSGYSQDDIIHLAKILTGWGLADPEQAPGAFAFHADRHEPGAQTVLNVKYDQKGVAQGEAVLRDIVRRPETARFVCTKLARHFVADKPPASLVERLAKTFSDTDGALLALYKTLITSPEAWTDFGAKIRNPVEFLFASTRATGAQLKPEEAHHMLDAMGCVFWASQGPDGYPGDFPTWATTVGMGARLEAAATIASKRRTKASAFDVGASMFGDLLSLETQALLRRQSDQSVAFAILLMAPEHQRR